MKFKTYVLLALLMIQCSRADHTPFNAGKSHSKLLQMLDPDRPGKGIDVFDEEIKNRPMAYGLILSATAMTAKLPGDTLSAKIMNSCGNWLLENADINQNGVAGYGLSDPWDAFADGSINPPDQEYTITTTMAINGLLDWYEVISDKLKREEIIKTVSSCLEPYLSDSSGTLPPYSFNSNDSAYKVFNPAILLAGQMQRMAKIVNDSAMAINLSNRSDDIVKFLLKHKLNDMNGNSYWNYGTYNKDANDLLHALYIIEGFRVYIENRGNHSDLIDWDNMIDHLGLFYQDGNWREHFTEKYRNDDYNARLWALGLLTYTLSLENRTEDVEHTVFPQLKKYMAGDGHFYFRENEERIMIRHEAHLLYGLGAYLLKQAQPGNEQR